VVLPLLSQILVLLLFVYYLDVLVRYGYSTLFVIVDVRCCPAAMVPVAFCEPEVVCIESPEKEGERNSPAGLAISVIVKGPEPNVISWLPHLPVKKLMG
jgi:hypothetical protein